ncbi:hypothetical protein BVZ80_00001 [Haemophilus influenzae]|nr:hypothetical protein BVZ79_01189 [Haemophilus influenzae]PRI63359.1 hypothetical protein BVZ80_00001 [Haemophilus influenzae]PRJ08738.1 hypothetical protein BV041_00260 [Haemophilus influenzae]PRK59772.1 hypothetical protein BV170_00810 [Haemophilus influenzae]PRL78856.1 hypothetical protein BV040_00001 [Haemophilus influenzae]
MVCSRVKLRALMFSLEISSVEAVKPLVLMIASLPIVMPFGLIKKTCPLESKIPFNWEIWSDVTRLNTAELLLSCKNCTISFWSMLNCFQLIIALTLLRIVVLLPSTCIVAVPCTTLIPCKPLAKTDCGIDTMPKDSNMAEIGFNAKWRTFVRTGFSLPFSVEWSQPRVNSDTATKAFRRLLNLRRYILFIFSPKVS